MNMSNDRPSSDREEFQTNPGEPNRLRVRVGLLTTLVGFFIFTVGAKPGWFGLDRSPGVGFVKITFFLFGLGILCLGGYVALPPLWSRTQRTIVSDIGMRLVATGFVISVFAGMADVFGMGSQLPPLPPYFGPLQATGVLLGQVVIAIGFLMLIPYPALPPRK
jgi:hypothetical protein